MESVRGVIFRRSIRSSYATLDVVLVEEEAGPPARAVATVATRIPPPSERGATEGRGSSGSDGKEEEEEEHAVVLVQFTPLGRSDATYCRSYFRRTCKLGDEVELSGGKWIERTGGSGGDGVDGNVDGDETARRRGKAAAARRFELAGYVPPSPRAGGEGADETLPACACRISVVRRQRWDNIRCQEARDRYYPSSASQSSATMNGGKGGPKKASKRRRNGEGAFPSDNPSIHGGGGGMGKGEQKRRQGDVVADFLIDAVMGRRRDSPRENEEESAREAGQWQEQRRRHEAIEYLSSGSGVVDAAGGSGHVSLALCLRGVRSTVVDPRPSVGRLPRRYRKELRSALKKNDGWGGGEGKRNDGSEVEQVKTPPPALLPPPVPFSSLRAWFAFKPEGVDTTFREGRRGHETQGGGKVDGNHDGEPTTTALVGSLDEGTANVPICSMCSPDRLLPTCRAIVALHPDEATGCIVDFAVENRIPFVVVPCCVFSRLFPDRFKPGSGGREIVSTYGDLIEYLVAKDPSIKVSDLPFDGANKAIWSTFDNDKQDKVTVAP